MIACENAGHSILDQFPEVGNLVVGGVAPREKVDYELTRYACYLIVQNGDPRKEVIALGQTYFAIQTYRQELADHFNQLDEDRRSSLSVEILSNGISFLLKLLMMPELLLMKNLPSFRMPDTWDSTADWMSTISITRRD